VWFLLFVFFVSGSVVFLPWTKKFVNQTSAIHTQKGVEEVQKLITWENKNNISGEKTKKREHLQGATRENNEFAEVRFVTLSA